MEPVCIFVHMPKAGGSTLQEILQRQYPAGLTFDIVGENMSLVQHSVDRLRALSVSEREKIICLKGHVPFGIHRWLARQPRYFTMLRDPVERVVSDYYFARNTPRHRLFERIRSERLTLKDFVRLRDEQGFSNLCCRMLGGQVNWENLADASRALAPGALQTAIGNIEQYFAVVGITERFDESLLLMQDAFGWSDLRYVRGNVTRDKPALAPLADDALEAIRRGNDLDIALYAHAVARLDARIAEAGPVFQERLRCLRRDNARYGRWRQLRGSLAERLPTPVRDAVRAFRRGIFS